MPPERRETILLLDLGRVGIGGSLRCLAVAVLVVDGALDLELLYEAALGFGVRSERLGVCDVDPGSDLLKQRIVGLFRRRGGLGWRRRCALAAERAGKKAAA